LFVIISADSIIRESILFRKTDKKAPPAASTQPGEFFQAGSDARIGREAAVHRQGDAGDEAGGLVADQEQQRALQLGAVAKAAHGGGGKDLAGAGGGGAVGVVEQALVLPGG